LVLDVEAHVPLVQSGLEDVLDLFDPAESDVMFEGDMQLVSAST
jgi:hypothetical protein